MLYLWVIRAHLRFTPQQITVWIGADCGHFFLLPQWLVYEILIFTLLFGNHCWLGFFVYFFFIHFVEFYGKEIKYHLPSSFETYKEHFTSYFHPLFNKNSHSKIIFQDRINYSTMLNLLLWLPELTCIFNFSKVPWSCSDRNNKHQT